MTEGDFDSRLSQILSDPESMAKIADLAKSFSSRSQGDPASPPREPEKEPLDAVASAAPASEPLALLPPGLLQDLTRHSGERAELLRAVRPFLERERQEKLDRVLSLLKTLDILALMHQ